MATGDQRGPGKLLGLELVRFVCALAVLVWHYQHFYHMAGSPAYVRDAQPLYWLLAPFYQLGLYGVQFFWGISGFIFLWKYGQLIADGLVGGGKFFVLRFSRLYPLHLVTLLLVAMLQPTYTALTGAPFIYENNSANQFLLHLGMATQWGAPAAYTFNGPIWSVSAEVFVYALFFYAARTVGRFRLALCAAVTAACVGIQLWGAVSPIVACAGYFFIGGIAAELHRRADGETGARWVALFALIAIIAGAWQAGLVSRGTAPLIILLTLPPLLFLAAQDWRFLDRLERPVQAAGNLTYSTYLCHFPLQLVVAIVAAASGVVIPARSPLVLVAYLAATMVVGRLVYLKFELPAQDAIRAWHRDRRQPALA